MRVILTAPSSRAILFLWIAALLAAGGCSRTKYRLQADDEAYSTIAERNGDPRWQSHSLSIEMDPRSRYFDPYDPDKSPMPADDPASHRYMHVVDNKKGWKHWHDNGSRTELENPAWREALAFYVDTDDGGAVQLSMDSAVRLAYVHSPQHQQQLETLYLSALDVSAERFFFDTQFFGGYDARYAHIGGRSPPGLRFDPATNSFIVTPPNELNRAEQNRLTAGRPAFGVGTSPFGLALAARKASVTAGELLVGFANSFVWEFTGGDANLASSLIGFNLVQPLLRGAGRDVALESLTRDERNLLANLRAYSQFRQGFYTQVAIGELGVNGPQRVGSGTSLQSFSGTGGVNGYLGLLRQVQEIRNSRDNLSLQLRTLARLEALYDNQLIDLVQLDQFRQGVEGQRTDVLVRENSLELSKDRYKQATLGLPPDLPITLDKTQIRQFELFSQESGETQRRILQLQSRVGDAAELFDLANDIPQIEQQLNGLAANAAADAVDELLGKLLRLVDTMQRRIAQLDADLAVLAGGLRPGEPPLTDAERQQIQLIRDRVAANPDRIEEEYEQAEKRLKLLQKRLAADPTASILAGNRMEFRELLQLSRACVAVQSRARRLDLEPQRVLAVAFQLIEPTRRLFDIAVVDLERMDSMAPQREKSMDKDQRKQFARDRERLRKRLADLNSGPRGYDIEVTKLNTIRDGLLPRTRRMTARGLTAWVARFLQIVERLTLVSAQARAEMIMVDKVELIPADAYQVALRNRLDFMNGRAALVDQWRLIQVNADALQAVVNVTANGDISTARNNPVSFRAPTGTFRLGLQFDAPFTRLLERNDYREALISFQRSRRAFIQSRDALHLGLRALLRNLEQQRQNLEIQRRAVKIALRRVDQTQLELTAPRPPGAPINPTTAINLIGAQGALQATQNQFLSTWLGHYATRMRLYRELGIMALDSEGQWIEYPLDGAGGGTERQGDDVPEELPRPQGAVDRPVPIAIPGRPAVRHGAAIGLTSYAAPVRGPQIRRLPPTQPASMPAGD